MSVNANVFDEDVTMSKDLLVTGKSTTVKDSKTFGRTFIEGDAFLYRNLSVSGAIRAKDFSFTGDLCGNFPRNTIPSNAIRDRETFNFGVSMEDTLFVKKDITTQARMFVETDAEIKQRLFVNGDTTLKNRLFVTDTAIFLSDISINGNLKINGNVEINHLDNSIPHSAIVDANIFTNDVTLDQKLFVANTAEFSKDVIMKDHVSMQKNLNITGDTTATNVTITGNLTTNFVPGSILPAAINGGVLASNAFDSTVTMGDSLIVNNDITVKNKLLVEDDVSFNKVLKVGGAVTMNNALSVAGAATFANNVSITGNLAANFVPGSISAAAINGGVLAANTLDSTVTMGDSLIVNNDLTVKDKLIVEDDAQFAKNVDISGNMAIANTLTVKDIDITGSLAFGNFANNSIPSAAINGGVLPANTLDSTVTMGDSLIVNNDITVKDKLFVEDDASFNKVLNVGGAVTMNNTLAVAGEATFTNNVSITGALSANFADGSISTAAINGGVLAANTLDSTVTMGDSLIVNNDITVKDKLFVEDDASFNKVLNVGGAVTMNNALSVAGAAIFSNNVSITGDLTANFVDGSILPAAINGGVLAANTLDNTVTMGDSLIVNNDITVKNKLFIEDDASFNKVLKVGGAVTMNDSLSVAGAATFNNNVSITGDLTANFVDGSILPAAINGGALPANTLNSTVTMGDSLIVNNNITTKNKLFVEDDASFNKVLKVGGAVTMNDSLSVAGAVTLNQGVSVVGAAIFENDVSINGTLSATFATSSVPSSVIIGGALAADTLTNDVTFAKKITVDDEAIFNNKINANANIHATKQLIVTEQATFNDIVAMNGILEANDASFNGNVYITNDLTVHGKLNVEQYTNNSVINTTTTNYAVVVIEDLSVNGSISIEGTTTTDKIIVNDDAIFNKGIDVTRKIMATNDIQTENRLYVKGGAVINGILDASFADQSIPASVIIGGALPSNSFEQNVTLSQMLVVDGDVSLNNKLSVKDESTFNDKLFAKNNIYAEQGLVVTGDSSMNNLNVANATVLAGAVNITGVLTANYAVGTIPQEAVIGLLDGDQSAANLVFDTDINMSKRLFVTDDISSNGRLYVSGEGTSIIKHDLTVGGTFTAAAYGAGSIPTEAITGLTDLIANSTTTTDFSEDISMNKRLFVTDDISSNGRLYVSGEGTSIIKHDLTVSGTFTAAAYGAGSIPTNAITGLTDLIANSSNAPDFSEDISMNKRLFIADDISSNGRLYVSGVGTSIIKNDLTVGGTFTAAAYGAGSIPTDAITGLTDLIANSSNAPDFSEDISMNKRLFVADDISSNGLLYVSGVGTSIIKNDLSVDGTFTAAAYGADSIPTDAIAGLATFITGASGGPDFSEDITLDKRLFVGDDISSNGRLYVSGDGTSYIKAALNVGNNFNVGSQFSVDATTGETITAAINANGIITGNSITDGTATMTNGSLDNIVNITASGTINVGTLTNTGILTLPSQADTLVGRSTTDTLSNKTLTTPTITSIKSSATNTITLPAVTGTVVTTGDIGSIATNMIADSAITNVKLSQLTAANKVAGSAVQLAAESAIENTTGLKIKDSIAGTGLTLAGQSLTINVAQDQITSVGTLTNLSVAGTIDTGAIDITNDANISGNLIVTGNMTVNGTTTSIHTANLDVSDNMILLSKGTTDAINDSGILIERGAADNAFMGWDRSESKFTMGTTTASGDAVGDLTIATGTLVANIEGNVSAGTLGVSGITTLAGALNANGGIACDTDRFTVADGTGNVDMKGTLDVTGATTIAALSTTDVTASGTMGITGVTTMTSAELSSTLGVVGATTMTSAALSTTLDVVGATTMTSAALSTTLDVVGASTMTSAALSSTLDVVGDATMTSAALSTTLDVSGAVALGNTLDVVGDTTMTSAALSTTMDVSGAVTMGNTLDVVGDATMTSAALSSTLDVSGATTLTGLLTANGDASFNSDLYVKQQVFVDGSMNINDSLLMHDKIATTVNYKYVDIPSPQGTPSSSGWTTTNANKTINWTADSGTQYENSGNYGNYTAFNNGSAGSGWLGSNGTYELNTGAYTAGLSTTIEDIGVISGDYLQLDADIAYKLTNYQFMTYGQINYSLNDKLPKDYYIVGSNDGATWYPIQKVNDLYLSADSGDQQYTNSYTISTNISEITEGTTGTLGYRNVTGYSTTAESYMKYRIVIESIHGRNSATTGQPYSISSASIGEWIINGQYKDLTQTTTENVDTSVQFAVDSTERVKLTGSLKTTGAIIIEGESTLNNNVSVADGKTFTVGTGATTIGGIVGVIGDASFNRNVYVKENVDVSGAVALGTTLDVVGDATMTSAALSTTLDVSGAVALGTTLDVVGDTTMTSAALSTTLDVSGAVALGNTLDVVGDTTMTSAALSTTLDVSGAVALGNTLDVVGDTTMTSAALSNTLDVSGAVALSTTLDVSGAVALSTTLDVSGAVALSTTLDVSGAVALGNTLDVVGDTTMTSAALSNTLDVSGAVALGNTLDIVGDTTMTSAALSTTLDVSGAVALSTTMDVSGAVALGNTLDVVGDTTMTSAALSTTMDVSGAVALGNTLDVVGDATMTSAAISLTMDVSGAVALGNTLDVVGDTTMTSAALSTTLDVSGATTLTGLLTANGDASFNSNVYVKENVDISGNMTVTGALELNGDVSLNSALFVANDISVNSISIGRGGGNISTNTVVGNGSMQVNSAGANNTSIGFNANQVLNGGSQNTAIGTQSLSGVITSNRNTAVGYNALSGTNDTGANTNTAVGAEAGANNSLGSSLTFLGADTSVDESTATYQKSTAIGAGAIITGSNQMVLGATPASLTLQINAHTVTGVANSIPVSMINIPLESIPASAIVGSSSTSTALTGAVFIENTLSVDKLATFKENLSVVGGLAVGQDTVLDGDVVISGDTTMVGTMSVPQINDMLTFVTYTDVAIASGLPNNNTNLSTEWSNVNTGITGLPAGKWLGGVLSETGQYQLLYNQDDSGVIYRSTNYGTSFEQKSLNGSIYNNSTNMNNVMAMDYTGKFSVFGGNDIVSYSINNGLTFNNLATTALNSQTGTKISAIGMSGNGKTLIVGGTNSQLFVSTDSSSLVSIDASPMFDTQYNNWKSISCNGAGTYCMAITDAILYITNPGADTLYNAIWEDKTSTKHTDLNLANVTDSFINNDGTIFGITTTNGLYLSTNYGASWISYAKTNGYTSVTYTYRRNPLIDGEYIYLTTVNSDKIKKIINAQSTIIIADTLGTNAATSLYTSVIVSGHGGYTYAFTGATASYTPYMQINTGSETVSVASGTAFVLNKDAQLMNNVSIGKPNPILTLDICGNDAIHIPVGSVIQRPIKNMGDGSFQDAAGNIIDGTITNTVKDDYIGSIRYNSDNLQFEGFGPGDEWGSLGGVINVAQNTKISAESAAASTDNELRFYTATGGSSITADALERMRIKHDGDISMNHNLAVATNITVGDNINLISDSAEIVFGVGTDATIKHNGTDGLDIDAAGIVSMNSSGGAINIGEDVAVGAINVGTGASARTITVGNAASTAVNANANAITLTSVDALTLTDGIASMAMGGTGATTISGATTLGLDATTSINIGTASSAIPITIGHSTSEVTVAENLTVVGNITMNGGSINTTDATETVSIFESASIINLGGTSTSINIGTGVGTATTVSIGATNDTVNIMGNLNITGTTTSINATNLDISDNAITLNKGGSAASFVGAGINIESATDLSAGYIRIDADQTRFTVRLPSLAGGTAQYMATKDLNDDLSANQFVAGGLVTANAGITTTGTNTVNGNITTTGNITMTGVNKFMKQF